MCRLYSFHATMPRKVECELIRAQNGLIAQSRRDEGGKSNPHGWGIGTYRNGLPHVERQIVPAYESASFRWAAAQVYARTVVAHIRRATVGVVQPANTHPFTHETWMLAHNGTLGAFAALRPRLLDAMTPTHRSAIGGDTDSEHVFYFLLSLQARRPETPLLDVLRQGLRQLLAWSQDYDPNAEIALNVIWTDGREVVGSRYGRSLWAVERAGVHPCEVCGVLHVEDTPSEDYQAVVVASERITTTESWTALPERSLFHVTPDARLHVEAL